MTGEGVTEDDVNEIKNDISAFRFEMIEIMRASGMNTRSASGPSGNLFLDYMLTKFSAVKANRVCKKTRRALPQNNCTSRKIDTEYATTFAKSHMPTTQVIHKALKILISAQGSTVKSTS